MKGLGSAVSAGENQERNSANESRYATNFWLQNKGAASFFRVRAVYQSGGIFAPAPSL